MKRLTVILIIIFLLGLSFLVFAEDNYSRKYKGIRIPVGKVFTIDLDSNPSTGYSWQLTGISDKAIIEIVKKEYVNSGSLTVGAPGVEKWIFKTIKSGKTVLTFEYRRSWEDDEPAQGKQVYTIIVK